MGWYRGEHVNQVPHGMGRRDGDDWYVIGEYKNGRNDGHATAYKANGRIWAESDWIDGKRHGHETIFNDDGSILAESDWIDGKKHGHETTFNVDGSISSQADYIHGVQQ